MTEEQINKEIKALLRAGTEAIIEHNYYLNQRIRVLQELAEMQKGALQLANQKGLLEEEKYKNLLLITEEQIKIKTANEFLETIKKQELHAKRRHEEKNKKLMKFCKQHGIDPFLYLPKG